MEIVAHDSHGHASTRNTRVPRETGTPPSPLKLLFAARDSRYRSHGYRETGGRKERKMGKGVGGARKQRGKGGRGGGSQGRKEGDVGVALPEGCALKALDPQAWDRGQGDSPADGDEDTRSSFKV